MQEKLENIMVTAKLDLQTIGVTASKPVKVKIAKNKLINDEDDNDGSLKPLFKWTGGKRREIKLFQKHFPDFVTNKKAYTYVEPFAGGAAVYWYLNNLIGKNIINDFDDQVVNFYKVFRKNDPVFVSELKRIGAITDHDELSKVYYAQRNKDKKGGLKKLSDVDQAIRFFVVNQLAFSGMRRFNASGEFNVPFGHYKGLNVDVIDSAEHKLLLDKTIVSQGDFEPVMKNNDVKNSFHFLDPPYTRVFKEYSSENSFGEKDHKRLADVIKGMKKASVMMIIDKSPFTENLYKGYIKDTYALKYGVNIKNRFNTAVQHLIVCNY